MHRWKVMLAAAGVAVAVQALLAVSHGTPAVRGGLSGPDDYMRVQRVREWRASGSWYASHQLSTNAPYGETLHWTRPLDVLLDAGARIGATITDYRTALLVWAIVLGPALLVMSVPLWSWAARPIVTDRGFVLMMAMLPLAPQMGGQFAFGSADHHALLLIGYLAMFGCVVRLSLGLGGSRFAAWAGAAAGLSMWVSVEAMPAAGIVGIAVALGWIIGREERGLRHLAAYATALAMTLAIALALERPPAQWTTPAYARISIVHVVLATVTTSACVIGAWASSRSRTAPWTAGYETRLAIRGATIAALGVPAAVLAAVVYPQFLRGPFAELDHELFHGWIDSIAEFRSTLPVNRRQAATFAAHLGPVLIGVAYAMGWWRTAGPRRRRMIAAMLLMLTPYALLALDAVRWAGYAQLVALPLWAAMCDRLLDSPCSIRIGSRPVPIRVGLAGAALLAPAMASGLVSPGRDASTPTAAASVAPWSAMGDHLREVAASVDDAGSPRAIVMTLLFRGPEVAWRSGLGVVGAPYGNGPAMRDTRDFFAAEDAASALAIVRRRGIDYVLLCPRDLESRQYRSATGRTFYEELEAGSCPAWLRPVELPPHLAKGFRLLRVMPEASTETAGTSASPA